MSLQSVANSAIFSQAIFCTPGAKRDLAVGILEIDSLIANVRCEYFERCKNRSVHNHMSQKHGFSKSNNKVFVVCQSLARILGSNKQVDLREISPFDRIKCT